MPHRSSDIQLTLALPAGDYRVYVSAARKLQRIIGRKAPDAPALIRRELASRDATLVAEEYLEACGRRRHMRIASMRRPSLQSRGHRGPRGGRVHRADFSASKSDPA